MGPSAANYRLDVLATNAAYLSSIPPEKAIREKPLTSIINRPLILVTSAELSEFASSLPDNIEILGVVEVTGDRIDVIYGNSGGATMTTAPLLCLGLLTTKPASLLFLEKVREVFQSWASYDFPTPQLVSPDTLSNGLSLLLSTSLVDRLRAYAANVTRLSRELFRLRAAHEDMLNAFAAVEGFVAASNIQACNLTFENDPSGVFFYEEGRATTVFQTLPVSSLGLSIVQVCLGSVEDNHLTGGLTAELRTVEDHAIQQVWQMPADALVEGWLTLPLRQALIGPQRTPLLILSVTEGIGSLPPLSLGSPQALSGFRLRDVDGASLADRSLALRTWTGVPGIRPAAIDIASNTMFEQPSAGVLDIPIPAQLFRTAKFLPNGWEPDFNPVSFLADLRGLECHPPPIGTTWAALPNLPIGTYPFRIDINVVARHPEAAEIEVALGFLDKANVDNESDFDTSRIPFSGWRVAPFGEAVLLSVLVENPQGELGCLILGARMKDGASNSCAWNCFSGLRKVVLRSADTAEGTNRTPPPAPAGLASPLIMIDGASVPLSILEAASDAVPSGLNGSPAIGYDPNRRGILCHPPAQGISLARVSTVSVVDGSRLSARAHVGNDLSGAIEFCLAISSVSADEVVQQLESGDPTDTASFAWSGWHEATYAEDVALRVDVVKLENMTESIFLATRMAATARTNDFAWAYFLDLRLASGDN